MKHAKHTTLLLCTGLFVGAAGCGAGVSDELMQARSTYQKAAQGQAMELEPEHVIEAKQALSLAERAHDEDANSPAEKHYAYIATRKAQQAMAKAGTTAAEQDKVKADESYVQLSDQRRDEAVSALQTLNTNLRIVRFELDAQDDDMSSTSVALREKEQELESRISELEKEQERRKQAEKRLKDALSNLKHMANVQAELENLIVTLNSAVLFEFAQADLMESAKERLDAVVSYLKELNSGKQIVIHGYTDSVGSDEDNLKLSRERAEAVKRYLVENGIDENRIETKGHGESQPLADNGTAGGRAINRRVEIDIQQ